jgi:ATP-binding cassette subfamily B protein
MNQLDEILKLKKEAKPEHPVSIGNIREVAFEDVSFAYPSGQEQALTNIGIRIPSGQTIALVGPSGSGKTSIIKLLVGLYMANQGQVEFNGVNINDLDKELLRTHIGFVSQDTQLFAGSIRDNLLFVKPDATDEECKLALEGASAMRIIERSQTGLDTKIGEGGLKLSGGEKQRLSIARALLRDPDLIIFDEATSSLDSLTEQEITDTIKQIKQNRPNLITVLVAHRLSTIVHADTIYVLEKGHIAESGSHEALLQKPGLYSALWRQQTATRE